MYPFFVLSGNSPYTSVITVLVLYTVFFLAGVTVYRNNPSALRAVWILFLFVSLHSLFVEQQRSPWNPSFVTPFLALSITALLFPEGGEVKRIIAMMTGLAFAVGLSYSVVPTIVVLFFAGLLRFRKRILLLVGSISISMLMVFLPLLVSEFKHNFFFFNQLVVAHNWQFAFHQNLWMKAREMSMDLFWGRMGDVRMLSLPFLVIVIASVMVKSENSRKLFWLFLASLLLTLISPFELHAHYVYGVLTLLLFFLASVPKRYVIFFLLVSVPFWFSKDAMQSTLYRPIRRTVDDLAACAQIICDSEKDPIYVTESAWHDYHYAPDHLFFLNKAGCHAKDITGNPGFAKRMAVVVDQGSYTYGKTSFNELTLFDPAQLVHYYACPGNIHVVMLEKIE